MQIGQKVCLKPTVAISQTFLLTNTNLYIELNFEVPILVNVRSLKILFIAKNTPVNYECKLVIQLS